MSGYLEGSVEPSIDDFEGSSLNLLASYRPKSKRSFRAGNCSAFFEGQVETRPARTRVDPEIRLQLGLVAS